MRRVGAARGRRTRGDAAELQHGPARGPGRATPGLRGETAPDPYAGVQTSNQRMDIGAGAPVSRGRGVRIALIDTGLASDHPELRGRIDVQRNFVDD